jgi:hypothetical protein
MINIIEGNLITMLTMPGIQAVAHGCNCFCKMGAGFALQLATAVPEVLSVDLITERGNLRKLGTYSHTEKNGIDYYNLYTQFYYGRRNVHFDIMAFRSAMTAAINDLKSVGKSSIHIPYIGAGLAGGEWDEIYAAIVNIDQTICKEHFVINIVNKVD